MADVHVECTPSFGREVVLEDDDEERGPLPAVAAAAIIFWLTVFFGNPSAPVASLLWVLNPTGSSFVTWLVLYVIMIPAKETLCAVLKVISVHVFCFRRIDERRTKLRVLNSIDLFYLAFNLIIEFVGVSHVVAFTSGEYVKHRLNDFSFFNGPGAFLIVLCLYELLNYGFNYLAHQYLFDQHCYRHQRRQLVAFHVYVDISNQHPVEQVCGFLIFFIALHIARMFLGLHVAAAWCCALSWAILSIVNHIEFDSTIHVPFPYPAKPRDHQMHLRFPQCNYSCTFTSIWDRVFESYKPFEEVSQARGTPDKKYWFENREYFHAEDDETKWIPPAPRPESVPSAWSCASLLVALISTAVAIEMYHLGGKLPDPKSFLHFIKTVIILGNLTMVCAAAEAAMAQPIEPKKFKRQDGKVSVKPSEALPDTYVRAYQGGKTQWTTKLMPDKPKDYKRE